MRKIFFAFIFLLANQFVFAQTTNSNDSVWAKKDSSSVSRYGIFALTGGQFQGDFSGLNSQLKSLGAAKTFSPFSTIGITTEGLLNVNRNGSFDAEASLEWFLRQEIQINDSLKFRLHGFHIMTSLYGMELLHKKTVSLVVGPGFDWGMAKIIRTFDGNKSHYNNGYIAPFARVEFRVWLGKFVVGVRGFYRLDLKLGEWTGEETNLPVLPNSKISGLGFQLFVGF